MKVAIASDHRGYHLKEKVISLLKASGHEVIDDGPASDAAVDYPDFAFEVSRAVSDGRVQRGILICGTGIGMCIAANKVPGVRAAPCHDSITAEMSRRHNDANVLCLSADLLGDELIDRMVRIWLDTYFESGRHARRVELLVRHRVHPQRAPVDQLREVLVAGGDHRIDAALLRLAHQRADHAVGFDAVHADERPAERGNGLQQRIDLRGELLRAAQEYATEVREGVFPGPEHSFD